jgi:hypothetical protein
MTMVNKTVDIIKLMVSDDVIRIKSFDNVPAELLYSQLHFDVTDIKIFQFPKKDHDGVFLWHYTLHMSKLAVQETGLDMNTVVVIS